MNGLCKQNKILKTQNSINNKIKKVNHSFKKVCNTATSNFVVAWFFCFQSLRLLFKVIDKYVWVLLSKIDKIF